MTTKNTHAQEMVRLRNAKRGSDWVKANALRALEIARARKLEKKKLPPA